MHNRGRVYHGSCLINFIEDIGKLVQNTKSETLLDYGSGKGAQYFIEKLHEKHFCNIMPTLYDIGILEYSKLPSGTFDGVFSTDVLEHIPEDELDSVLEYIFNVANKFVYLAICTIEAPDLLPNGEQAHVTIKPFDWWIKKITPFVKVDTTVHCYGKETSIKLIKVRNDNETF
jgi:hypothetical protein